MNTQVVRIERDQAKPHSNRDFNFFYEGLKEGKLLVQKCTDCGRVRNPPGPMCQVCHSLRWSGEVCRGTGTVYSYTIHHHPPLPSFDAPLPVVLVEMSEGHRMLGTFSTEHIKDIRIGLPVKVEFITRGSTATFRFRPA